MHKQKANLAIVHMLWPDLYHPEYPRTTSLPQLPQEESEHFYKEDNLGYSSISSEVFLWLYFSQEQSYFYRLEANIPSKSNDSAIPHT